MNVEQIQQVVSLTIDELIRRKFLDVDDYKTVIHVVNKRLSDYFNGGQTDTKLTDILHQLSDDAYIDIIYLQYRDWRTLEVIAEIMDKDVSTIKRNKRRLIMTIYKLLEE